MTSGEMDLLDKIFVYLVEYHESVEERIIFDKMYTTSIKNIEISMCFKRERNGCVNLSFPDWDISWFMIGLKRVDETEVFTGDKQACLHDLTFLQLVL